MSEVLLYKEIFLSSLQSPLADLLDLQKEAIFSMHIDETSVQDSFQYRGKHLGLKVASLLIDEQGELNEKMVGKCTQLLDQGIFVLGPRRVADSLIYSHIQQCLKGLTKHPEIWGAIRKFSTPLCHKKAEGVVRETLFPEPIRVVQTAHVRRAVLAAWFTPLRQSTGSCFATAPAILIQQKEPLQFFKDLYDLLTLGQLKRVFGGKEYAVPLSFSSGLGDLGKIVSFPFFGLGVALEAVGVAWTEELQRSVFEMEPQSVEKILRAILLKQLRLTEEDLRDEEYLASIQMTPLLAKQGISYYQRPSERSQKISDWKKGFEKACIAFKTMTECALLRSWEYTIASLSDVKTEFGRWNLYIGLGLHPDQKDGIGAFLYEKVNHLLQESHKEIEKLSQEYEKEVGAAQALEVMFRGATEDGRRNQIKADWTARRMAASTIAEIRNQLVLKAESLVGLFSWLIQRYDEKLQEYFQELFDPAIAHDGGPMYEDSPAGFRLFFKHGRTDASQWSAAHTKEDYIGFLRDFFSRMENELEVPSDLGKDLVSELTTALIQFIQGDLFFKGAMARSKEKGRLSPWDYVSGGTLQTLLMAYRNRDRSFTEKAVVPRSEKELLAFFISNGKKGECLMHSPTHAFAFRPELLRGKIDFQKGESQKWTEAMQEHLIHKLSDRLPEAEKAMFLHLIRQKTTADSNRRFRENLLEVLGSRVPKKLEIVDGMLYENTFLIDADQAQRVVAKITQKTAFKIDATFLGSSDLYEFAKMVVLQSTKSPFSKIDWDAKIAEELRKLRLLPEALLFADTNWSGWFFGFVQNPVTAELELWRLNRTATQGYPMSDWKEWTSFQNTSAWIILSEPKEYL